MELMALHNIDYNTARRIIIQGFPIVGQSAGNVETRTAQFKIPTRNLSNFLALYKPLSNNVSISAPSLLQDNFSFVTASRAKEELLNF